MIGGETDVCLTLKSRLATRVSEPLQLLWCTCVGKKPTNPAENLHPCQPHPVEPGRPRGTRLFNVDYYRPQLLSEVRCRPPRDGGIRIGVAVWTYRRWGHPGVDRGW